MVHYVFVLFHFRGITLSVLSSFGSVEVRTHEQGVLVCCEQANCQHLNLKTRNWLSCVILLFMIVIIPIKKKARRSDLKITY